MKTENFDDALRRKVESINYDDVTNADVEKVHGYVLEKRKSASNKKKFAYLAAAAILTLFISLISWNVVQLKQNASLQKSIDSLTTLVYAKGKKIIVKTDTVFVTQTVGNSNLRIQKLTHYSNNNATTQQPNSSIKNTTQSQQKSYTNNVAIQPNINNISLANDNVLLNAPTTNVDNSQQMIAVSEINEVESIKKNDSVFATQLPELSDTTKLQPEDIEPLHESIAKPKFKLKKLNYKIGLVAEKTNGQAGFGIISNIEFSKKWSLNVGAKLLTINNEHFKDENEFNHSRRQPFKNEYSMPMHDSSSITNIGIKNNILQLPFAIAYSVFLKNNYSLCFALGTDLDLIGKQHVDFRRNENSGNNNKSLDIKLPILTFNNATISAGVQKTWRNVSLQFAPFISPQITAVSYKKENIYYGGKLLMLYKF